MFKYDFTCICETYFDSIFSSDNNNLNISGYNLIRADHPSNSKRGSVCIYYKESLAVQTLNNMGLTECLVCKVCLGNKTGNVVVTYRYPSQTYLEFQKNLNHFDTLLQNLQNSNPHFTMILGDFCRNSEEETSSQKKTLQKGETVYVTFCKFQIVDVTYLNTEQLNWSLTVCMYLNRSCTQCVCEKYKRSNYHCNY